MAIETPERPATAEPQVPSGPQEAKAVRATQELAGLEPGPEVPALEEVQPEGPQQASILLTSLAIFLAVSAAGWMAAGVFRGPLARGVAVLGAVIGVGIVAFSYRSARPSIIQYMALPAALVVGAILVLPFTGEGTASLPGLVVEAVRTGGVAQPPIPFDPGWRFILLVLIAVLGAAAASLATALNKPKVGIFMPVPLLFAAALVQPKEGTLLTSGAALVLLVAALGVSYGVELAQEGATSGQFELRRLARGGVILAALVGLLVLLSQVGWLFPEPNRDQVIPPKKPEVQPPQADRVLFTVQADRPGPWRLGVLDVYEGGAWLLPPYDSKRFEEVAASGRVKTPSVRGFPAPDPEDPDRPTLFTARFTIKDVEGHVLPNVANTINFKRTGFALQHDPRTQMFRLPESRAQAGMNYTVEAPAPPGGKVLSEAPAAPASFREYLAVPPPPNEVVTLLAEAPPTNNWDRLQFVRNAFYQKVVAAGAGNPVDVPAGRVAEMLTGAEATPYEITAAEALLARWAGIPSRIGYGFYGGDKPDPAENLWEVRPRHGSTWLEAYFEGQGWVAIVGVPPRAKASLSQSQKQENPAVRPTEELALVVYVPIKLQTITLLYVYVRYWFLVSLPVVIALLLIWAFFPGVVKAIRRVKRRRWATRAGLRARVAAAYAELRDAANDLNIGDEVMTPLEFLQVMDVDDEHQELAWLVTRALWGDLARDLRPEDAEAAEDMAASVIRRLRRAQSLITRMLAFGSRTSLRSPYSEELPNLWPKWAKRGAVRSRFRIRPVKRLKRILPTSAVLMIAVLAFTSCGGPPPAVLSGPVLPDRIAPPEIEGFVFQRETGVEGAFKQAGSAALVQPNGQVYSIRQGPNIVGSLQIAPFKPGFGATRREVREGVLRGIGTGRFELTRIGAERIYTMRTGEQRFFMWFPGNGRYFELLVAQQGFEEAGRIFTALIAYQRGEEAAEVFDKPPSYIFDPRRGGEE